MIDNQIQDQVIATLLPYHPYKIGVFGSYARGDNNEDSDLDILVSFEKRISLLKLVQIQQKLSDKLGIKVDLVTENGLKNPRLKKYIKKDLISIYQ